MSERPRTQRRKRAIQHRKMFDRGRRTPQEYHQQTAFPLNAKCAACGRPPAVRALVFVPLADARRLGMFGMEELTAAAAAAMLQTVVQLKGPSGPVSYVRVSSAYSCKSCQPAFEKTLAKAPSWCVVEIQRGPDPTNRVVVGAN